MPKYLYKDAVALAFDANKKRLRLEGRILLDRIMNEALAEMTHEFNAGLERGELLNVGGSPEDLRRFLRVAAGRELGAGDEG